MNNSNNIKTIDLHDFLGVFSEYTKKDFNSDFVNFEVEYELGELLLDVFFGEGGDNDFHIELKCKYSVINDENGITDDIGSIKVIKVTKGNGYDDEEVIVDGLNESNLEPILSIMFDKHSDRSCGKYNSYCINLINKGE